jgi:hypothetical protein
MGAEPLYILEGKEVNSTIMAAIPGTEIQSIDVIKDKAAAIYGEKGKKWCYSCCIEEKRFTYGHESDAYF